jgi:hypothetical protein
MKVMRIAPIISAVALLAGSSAFAQKTSFFYGVAGGGMGNAGVLTQPAVLGGGCNACDPYLPLWQQSVIDTKGCWGQRVSGLPNVLEGYPSGMLSQAAVVGTGYGGTILNQGAVLENSAIAAPLGGNVITQPTYIQGTNPYDINMFQGAECAPTAVQEQPAVVEQPAAPEQPQLFEKTTVHTVKTTRITTQKQIMPITFKRVICHHKHRRICHHEILK